MDILHVLFCYFRNHKQSQLESFMKTISPKFIFVLVIIIYFVIGVRAQEMSDAYFGQTKPEKLAKPFALEFLSNKLNHYVRSITFTPDGNEAYWPVIDLEARYMRWIVGAKMESGKWTEAKIPSFSKKGWEDDVPCISPDGSKMFFISRRPVYEGDTSFKENIWMMKFVADSWSDPEPLPPVINALGAIHQQLSLDLNGTLYFSCETSGNYGELDIFMSKNINGEYQKSLNLGPEINGKTAQYSPFISSDGSYLIFTRNVEEGWTLFISFRNEDDSWSTPIDIKGNIEGTKDENLDGAYVIADGKYLIFFGEKDTITPYWVSTRFIEELRPKDKR